MRVSVKIFWLIVPSGYFSGSGTNLKTYDNHSLTMTYLFLCYNLIHSSEVSCICIINRLHISLTKLHALPKHFNRVNVFGNDSFEFAMSEISSGITSEINTFTKNYNQSARNNFRTFFEVN